MLKNKVEVTAYSPQGWTLLHGLASQLSNCIWKWGITASPQNLSSQFHNFALQSHIPHPHPFVICREHCLLLCFFLLAFACNTLNYPLSNFMRWLLWWKYGQDLDLLYFKAELQASSTYSTSWRMWYYSFCESFVPWLNFPCCQNALRNRKNKKHHCLLWLYQFGRGPFTMRRCGEYTSRMKTNWMFLRIVHKYQQCKKLLKDAEISLLVSQAIITIDLSVILKHHCTCSSLLHKVLAGIKGRHLNSYIAIILSELTWLHEHRILQSQYHLADLCPRLYYARNLHSCAKIS